MIRPRVTWAALAGGLIALAAASSPVVSTLAGLPGPINALFGPTWGPKITAACALIAAIALAVTARGRSIDPATDAGPTSASSTSPKG